ncbi:sigma-54-dependent Fis family transcriptional regulator [Desulfuromonas sp. TF]|uniref:sigma-54-dependent Fis family transcriptional regulator n=1 Tax=Desulfuromonas sp. TF TaxID=1232410 RepID=UPI00041F5AD9|nr:sigma-54-dependent Fis family transcriptional regulator [Desulfuromonas sp. TF]
MTRKYSVNTRLRNKERDNRPDCPKPPEGPSSERRHFDKLLISISTRFKNVGSKELDGEIAEGLKEIAGFFGCDRIALWEFTDRGEEAFLTHHFAVRGAEPPFNRFLNEEFPYLTRQLLQEQIVCVARVDELPDLAAVDRKNFQHYGVKSLISLPIFMAGAPRGCLSLSTLWHAHEWSEAEVFQLRRIGSELGNALSRKISNELIEERIRFETLISDLSARFINIPFEDVDDAANAALDQVRTFFRADYCVLFELCTVTDENRVAFVSYAPEVPHLPEGLDPKQAFPAAYDMIVRQGKPCIRERSDDLPPEADTDKRTRKELGIEAGLNIPIDFGSPVMYCLNVATLRPRAWPAEYISRIRLLGEIIVDVLKRKQLDLELKRSFDEVMSLKSRIELEADYLRSEIRVGREIETIIGQSEAIKNVLIQIDQVAPTTSIVLIHGETGTGKELVAQAVHNLSARRERLMIKVNCASLPGALVESELFGREKGAYTGALTRQAGRFEIADGSTIFLDEIGELSTELQAKLLRVLQEGSFERLGSPKTIKVDIRVIVATNRNLEEEVHKGNFREDLFYRLNVFSIFVPPLRQRRDDIPMLAWNFIHEFSERMGKKINKIARNDMEALQRYSWPGNIRELRNVIERAAIVSTGDTLNLRLPENGHSAPSKIMTIEEIESRHISEVLQLTGWRIKGEGGAAKLLGMNPSTLYSRMLKLGITSRSG